jgi:putative oxidoreductase
MEIMEKEKSKALNVFLWVAQSLLAVMFFMAGIMKFTTSIEDQRKMEWAKHVSEGLTHFIGLAEIVGAIGLLLPSILRIKPKLTAWAAIGIAIIMLLALALNVSIGETKAAPFLLVLTAIALFIAWGRFKKAPLEPRK